MDRNKIICLILRRRERIRHETEHMPFESSSIGDLAFLLLIFFIVTGSFVLRQGIFFSLPSRTAGTIKLEPGQIIDVHPDNIGFRYNEEIISRDRLKEVLIARKKEAPDCVLIIHMSPEVKYNRLVDTLSVAKESGIKRVSLKNVGGGT